MRKLENIQPERVFWHFEELCRIPHGSGNTAAISEHIAAFAEEHGLRYVRDEMNNCIIWEKLFKFSVQLASEGLIVRYYQSGLI